MKATPIVKSKEEATGPTVPETNDIQLDAVSYTLSAFPIVNRMNAANYD